MNGTGLTLEELRKGVPKAIREEVNINPDYHFEKSIDINKNVLQANIKEDIKAAIDKLGLTNKAKIRHLNRLSAPQEKTPQAALNYAIKHLSERSATWNEGALITTATSFAIGVLSKQDIEQQIEQYKKAGILLKAKSPQQNIPEGALTTKEMLDLELKNIQLMRAAKDTRKAIYDPCELNKMVLEHGLNNGQRDAVLLMLTAKDRIVGVQGYAGTGDFYDEDSK